MNGRGTSTLPLYVFGQIRVGVTPSTNAIAAVMLLITLGILLAGQFRPIVPAHGSVERRRRGGDGGGERLAAADDVGAHAADPFGTPTPL